MTTGPMAALMARLRAFQHDRLLPALVAYATHPVHVLLAMALWACLLVFGSVTVFALIGGNYFNGLAGVIGCLTLGAVTHLHHSHTQAVADLHARHDEQRQRLDTQAAQLRDLHTLLRQVAAQTSPAIPERTTPATPRRPPRRPQPSGASSGITPSGTPLP